MTERSPQLRPYDPALLKAWREGVDEFNSRRYWEAHEKWEQGWKALPEPDRSWVQAWIQLAGVLCLLEKGRAAPARSLALRAISKLEHSRAMSGILPRIEVEGGEEFLKRNLDTPPGETENARKALKAKLLSNTGL